MHRATLGLLLLLGCVRQTQETDSESTAPVVSRTVAPLPEPAPVGTAHLIDPASLEYRGAFRLPDASGGSNWEWSGQAMTYFPAGDPNGPDDGYPGSLFAVGHDHQQQISEISIPVPVKSPQKQLQELPTATTLQPFHEVRGSLRRELEIPRVGLEYLPATDGGVGKLHFCWGQHFEFENEPTHGWCEIDLAKPQPQGLWRLDDYTNYVTNDFLFEIPESWGKRHLPDYRMASGRFRDGTWGGLGPALVAYRPPSASSPPANGSVVAEVKPLLMYGTPLPGVPELEVSPDHKMNNFSEADDWTGGAWLAAGDRSAVILVGTKGSGKTWYGFANGVVYPTSGDPNDPVPDVPPFPYDMRGWWSTEIHGQMLFFDPEQLAQVAAGELKSWEPQPYAVLELDEFLFDPGFDHPRQKRYSLAACAFDRARQMLYLLEHRGDEDKCLVHVFHVR